MRRAKPGCEYTVSSGNVFRDLGLPNADELLTKSSLLYEISETIRTRGLNQVEAAKVMGISQPRISNLLQGRATGFSVHRLSVLLAKLGKRVTLVVSDEPPPAGPLHIPVVRDSSGWVGRLTRVPVALDASPGGRYSAARASQATRKARTKPQRPRARAR